MRVVCESAVFDAFALEGCLDLVMVCVQLLGLVAGVRDLAPRALWQISNVTRVTAHTPQLRFQLRADLMKDARCSHPGIRRLLFILFIVYIIFLVANLVLVVLPHY